MAVGILEEVVGARAEILGPSPEAWYDRLEREEALLEESLEQACSANPQLGLEAVSVLAQFWFHRGRIDSGRRWISRLLDAGADGPSPERALALRAAGGLAFRQADNEVAKGYEHAALDMARMLQRPDIEAEALVGLARTALRDRDPQAVFDSAGAARVIAGGLGDDGLDLSALHCMAEAARMAGRTDEARALYVESLERNRARGAEMMVAVELNNLAFVENSDGRSDVAERDLRQAISISLRLKNTYLLAHHLVAVAAVVAGTRPVEAAQLLGQADSLFTQTGLSLDPADEPERDHAAATARTLLGESRYESEYLDGATLDPARYADDN